MNDTISAPATGSSQALTKRGAAPWRVPLPQPLSPCRSSATTWPKRCAAFHDSKEMAAPQRERLSDVIKEVASVWGIGHSSAEEIDRQGIAAATKTAMQRALDKAFDGTECLPDCLFLDYMPWPERSNIAQLSIVDGDKHSLTIACASVLAKVWRDQTMRDLDRQYSGYGFARQQRLRHGGAPRGAAAIGRLRRPSPFLQTSR